MYLRRQEPAGILSAFFDESESDAPDPNYIAVGGVLFADRGLKLFRGQWEAMFDPYGGCHMADLYAGKGAFNSVPLPERMKLRDRAASVISHRVLCGVVTLVNRSEFETKPDLPLERAYGTCCTTAVVLMKYWLEESRRPEQRIHYAFEMGYTKKNERREARDFFDGLDSEFMKETYRSAGFSFLNKKDAIWLQAADFLAWETRRLYIERYRTFPEVLSPTPPALRRLEEAGKLIHHIIDVRDLEQRFKDEELSGHAAADAAFAEFQRKRLVRK